ncbi:MAG: class I SAM-dependent methyltransferase, partial [bacterium]
IGLALRKAGGGRVLSLEHDEVYATRTSENLALYGLGDFTRVIHSPLEEISIGKASHLWYDLSVLEEGLPRIDMLIIDGPPGKTQPQARYPALPLLADRLHEEAVILLDDGKRHDEKLIVQRWSEDHPGLMALKIDTEKGAFMIQKVGGGPPRMSSRIP